MDDKNLHDQQDAGKGLAEYRAFIASRAPVTHKAGFSARPINAAAKAHQVSVLNFALERGKSAAFLDTGLGKSFIELEFARQCAEETGKPSLILTPLAVAGQMMVALKQAEIAKEQLQIAEDKNAESLKQVEILGTTIKLLEDQIVAYKNLKEMNQQMSEAKDKVCEERVKAATPSFWQNLQKYIVGSGIGAVVTVAAILLL